MTEWIVYFADGTRTLVTYHQEHKCIAPKVNDNGDLVFFVYDSWYEDSPSSSAYREPWMAFAAGTWTRVADSTSRHWI